MRLGDILILGLVAVWILAALFWMYKRKKSGQCIGCSGCDGSHCASCNVKKKE